MMILKKAMQCGSYVIVRMHRRVMKSCQLPDDASACFMTMIHKLEKFFFVTSDKKALDDETTPFLQQQP